MGYVLLPTRATRNYVVQQTSRLGERGVNVTGELERHARRLGGAPGHASMLLPCVSWYDSTHVASCAYYRQLFAAWPGIGGFIESKLGPLMVDDFAALGCTAALGKWRAFLYDDGDDAPCVGHLNGSKAQPLAELDAEHAANPGRTGTVGRRWKPTDSTGAAEHEAACQELCARDRLHETTTGTRLPARSPLRLALTIDIDAPHCGDVNVGLSLHTVFTIY